MPASPHGCWKLHVHEWIIVNLHQTLRKLTGTHSTHTLETWKLVAVKITWIIPKFLFFSPPLIWIIIYFTTLSHYTGNIYTVFGATGQLGRLLVNNLGKEGNQVVAPYRGTEDYKRHLKIMGDLGQIVQPRYDLRYDDQIYESVKYSDVVYNLIGRDYATKNFSLDQIFVDGPRKLARIAREAGVQKFIHVSALNASKSSDSEFLRLKAHGEDAVLSEFPTATIVRPAMTYGNCDRLLNMIYFYDSTYGYMPIPNTDAVFHPVYNGDVAKVLSSIPELGSTQSELYELYGPEGYTLEEFVQLYIATSGSSVKTIKLPESIGSLVTKAIELFYLHPLATRDDFKRFKNDDVFTKGAKTFASFNIKPFSPSHMVEHFNRAHRTLSYTPPALQKVPNLDLKFKTRV